MKPGSNRSRILIAAGIVATTLTLISWDFRQDTTQAEKQHIRTDTVPQNQRERKVRDLDEAIYELDNVNIQLEMEKAMKSVNEAMKNFDMAKVKLEVDKAMKQVDMAKIQEEVNRAMKDIDFQKIGAEAQAALAKVDWKEMQKSFEEVKKINFEKMEIDMKEVQKNMDKIGPELQKEMEKIGPEIQKSMEMAKVEMEKAKVNLKEYKGFVDGLDQDGLINKKDSYTIEHKDGKLLINGKEASNTVYEKYRTFLSKHDPMTIKKNKDDFNIDMD